MHVEQALWRPAPGRKCIWDLVVHIAYWKYTVRRHLAGGPQPRFPRSPANFPRLPEPADEAPDEGGDEDQGDDQGPDEADDVDSDGAAGGDMEMRSEEVERDEGDDESADSEADTDASHSPSL